MSQRARHHLSPSPAPALEPKELGRMVSLQQAADIFNIINQGEK